MSDKLSQIQEELAQAYILCHGNQTKAYRTVHPNSKATTKTIWELACKAFRNDKVQARIQELHDMATQAHLVTVASITTELEESYKMAKDLEQPGHMTTSSVAKGKLHGYFIEKKELSGSVNFTNMTNEELEEIANGD